MLCCRRRPVYLDHSLALLALFGIPVYDDAEHCEVRLHPCLTPKVSSGVHLIMHQGDNEIREYIRPKHGTPHPRHAFHTVHLQFENGASFSSS